MPLSGLQLQFLAVFALTQGFTHGMRYIQRNVELQEDNSARDPAGNSHGFLFSASNDQRSHGPALLEEKVSRVVELLEKLIANQQVQRETETNSKTAKLLEKLIAAQEAKIEKEKDMNTAELLAKLISTQENTNIKLDEIIKQNEASRERDLKRASDQKSSNDRLDQIINCSESKTNQNHGLLIAQNGTNEKLSELINKTDVMVSRLDSISTNVSVFGELVDLQKSLNPTLESNNNKKTDIMTKLHRFLHSKNRELMGMRPKIDTSKPIIVMLAVDVYQVIEMNEAEEYLKANIHVNITFYNEFLGWNPTDFGNITQTEIDFYDKMWMPDIFAYNGMDMKNENSYFRPIPRIRTAFDEKNKNVIETLAAVEYTYPRIVKFSCSFDTFYFPFDYQLCILTFRSWAHPKQQIYIVASEHGENYTKPNDEWDIRNISQNSSLIRDKSSGDVFSVYQEEILMKRRPLYYIVNLIVPSVIITQVAFFGFFSPSSSEGDRTEKVNLGMGTLLAMSVLLLTVCGMTPVTSSHIPLMGIFFLTNMVLISIGVGTTTFIMAVHQRGKRKKRVPKWVQTYLFFKVAPPLGLKIPAIIRQSRSMHNEGTPKEPEERKQTQCESLLLEQIPQVKQLSEHFESVINKRRRALAEVEYIFLAKILDGLMLLLFSSLLYICVGSVILIALQQNIPTVSEKQPMEWISEIYKAIAYKSTGLRLADEFMDIFDRNEDGTVNRSEFVHVYGKIRNTSHSVFQNFLKGEWIELEINGELNQNYIRYRYEYTRNRVALRATMTTITTQ